MYGASQGSVLGLMLFTLLFNDLPLCITKSLLICVYHEYDCISLQEDVHEFYNSFSTWQLNLKFAKCSILSDSSKETMPF